ncbi:Structural maintenance of chromosomes protein 2-2 [Vitis vinifera]|uniref:Structural maintenance of chromosomes protein 2-2 n=1 Tax=Vitis vinifera TaxID=29760 RepID=A0A438C7S3_VITVI|nr:Structural maintenance of chromosomes protein 2-2 [Vitis vinifera]
MKECDSQISYILKEQEKLQHKLSEMNIGRKKLENEVKRMEMEQKDFFEVKPGLNLTKVQAEQSGDFGSVFSTLLPSTMEKLESPEGCSFLDGLEVRVTFGSVWK